MPGRAQFSLTRKRALPRRFYRERNPIAPSYAPDYPPIEGMPTSGLVELVGPGGVLTKVHGIDALEILAQDGTLYSLAEEE